MKARQCANEIMFVCIDLGLRICARVALSYCVKCDERTRQNSNQT